MEKKKIFLLQRKKTLDKKMKLLYNVLRHKKKGEFKGMKVKKENLGAIYGDIIGSVYEFHNWKHMTVKEQQAPKNYFFTDDTILTIATMKSLIQNKIYGVEFKFALLVNYVEYAQKYPASYGNSFRRWLSGDNGYKPYGSYGNGSAMRCSPCGLIAQTKEEAKRLGGLSAEVTHNHSEGIKGAECVSVLVWMAKNKCSKQDIIIEAKKYYDLNFTLAEKKMSYAFDETCQKTLPVAIKCFEESNSFDEAMQNVIEVGGDTDTIGAITMAIAATFYQEGNGMTDKEVELVLDKLPQELKNDVFKFEVAQNILQNNTNVEFKIPLFEQECKNVQNV